jgi:hypothetical protein
MEGARVIVTTGNPAAGALGAGSDVGFWAVACPSRHAMQRAKWTIFSHQESQIIICSMNSCLLVALKVSLA